MTTHTNTPDPALPPIPEALVRVEGMPRYMAGELRDYGRACYEKARADLIAELRPVAWRYQTPTGWHATTDAGKALVLRDHHPTEPLAIIPKE